MKYLFTLLLAISAFSGFGQTAFEQCLEDIRLKDYFSLRTHYASHTQDLSVTHQRYTEAFLDNAFNRLTDSENKVRKLLKSSKDLPDSLRLKLYALQEDNLVKLFRYKEAMRCTQHILSHFGTILSEAEREDYANNLRFWSALKDVPPQTVALHASSQHMNRDKAGLHTLKVSASDTTLPFIFDTGANFSTVPESTATRLGMRRLNGTIELGAITGNSTQAGLAVCPLFYLGDIAFRNVIFLVIPDENLTFPSIGYQIHGIIGYPVIAALKEIQIGQDDTFTVPATQTVFSQPSNIAMDQLIPILQLGNRHYTFDSGANETILYSSYYKSEQSTIDSRYMPETISFGGAAGAATFQGFYIDFNFQLSGKNITLPHIPVLKEPRKENETVYGNIGQDVIRQFPVMILNLDQMHLEFR